MGDIKCPWAPGLIEIGVWAVDRETEVDPPCIRCVISHMPHSIGETRFESSIDQNSR